MHQNMPIGMDDFADVRGGYYYVDKTDFLVDFLQSHAQVTLFTRPRRFGKTLTMSMLRYFLDIDGAEEHRKLFSGLKVERDAETMSWQGTRPVIFLTFKGWHATSWETLQKVILDMLGKIFDDRSFLLESPKATEREKRIFYSIQMGQADLVTCRQALALLLQLMEKYYGRKPVLLLDEYDVPIQSGWEHDYYNEVIDFFREFLSAALKTNPSLDFAVLTGVLRIAKENIFSALNNLLVDSMLQMRYPEAFGFTTAEVEQLTRDLGCADKMEEIRYWYDGYRFAGQEIYNPWSVVNYFAHHCQAETYWVNTSGNSILGELMRSADREHFEALETLLQGGTVSAFLQEGVIYSDIGEDQDALYTLLCTTGYLTVERIDRSLGDPEYTLRLPNREMLSLFGNEVVRRYQSGFGKSSLVALMRALLQGDVRRVQYGLASYLEKLASVYDTAKGKESFYHGFVLGMTAILVPRYTVHSNRESGYGRYDLAAMPQDKCQTGFVLEFKVAGGEDELPDKAQEALQQIKDRDYDAEFHEHGVQEILHYGIAFCGKKVHVKLNEG